MPWRVVASTVWTTSRSFSSFVKNWTVVICSKDVQIAAFAREVEKMSGSQEEPRSSQLHFWLDISMDLNDQLER